MKRLAAGALLAATLLLPPTTARAALLRHYDIDSLAFQSDAIALVTKLHERKIDEYRTMTTVRVVKSYVAGSAIHEGDVFDLDYGDYSFEPMFGWPADRPTPTVSPDVIVFLKKHSTNQWRPKDDASPIPPWEVVSSGVRMFVDGKVTRFAQMNNPGGYAPINGKGSCDRDRFERAIARSVARADSVHHVLAEPSSRARTIELLALLPPLRMDGDDAAELDQPDPHDEDIEDINAGDDEIGKQIIRALGDDAKNWDGTPPAAQNFDFDAFLDARARTTRVEDFGLQNSVSVEKLALAALNESTPLHRRLAAISLLGGLWFELSAKPKVGDALGQLFSDPNPEIRKAACELSFTDGQAPIGFLNALVEQFPRETDPRAKFAQFSRARQFRLFDRLVTHTEEMPLAMAEVRNGHLRVAWAWIDSPSPSTYASRVSAELRTRNGPLFIDLTDEVMGMSSTGYEQWIDLPLTVNATTIRPGIYDVTISVVISDVGNEKHVRARRTFALGKKTFTARIANPAVVTPSSIPDNTTTRPTRGLLERDGFAIFAGLNLAFLVEALRRLAFPRIARLLAKSRR